MLVVLEYKASSIRNAVRYADDAHALEQVLEERFVQGGALGRKGLTQLAHAIRKFADGNRLIESRGTGATVHPDEISKILPVLVHLDTALRTPGIPRFMYSRFKTLGRAKRFTITPLILVPIPELEEIEGHLSEFRFADVMESFCPMLRTDRTAVFLAKNLPILKGKHRANGTTLRRFDTYMDGMLSRLFPAEAALRVEEGR